jgi:hypothetical protein
VRQDKSISQRLKLRRAADAFDFNALIEGVSTLVDEPKREAPKEPRTALAGPETAPSPPALPLKSDMNVGPDVALLANMPTVEPAMPVVTEPGVTIPLEIEPSEVETADVLLPDPSESAAEDTLAREPAAVAEPVRDTARAPQTSQPSGAAPLSVALATLGGRLVDEVARMGAAMRAGDADTAGFYLAHTNQVLELLGTIDPTGELSREFRTDNAPPQGRAWPATAWSVAEFAGSPFSALLSPDADEEFVQDLVYASWGVSRSR